MANLTWSDSTRRALWDLVQEVAPTVYDELSPETHEQGDIGYEQAYLDGMRTTLEALLGRETGVWAKG